METQKSCNDFTPTRGLFRVAFRRKLWYAVGYGKGASDVADVFISYHVASAAGIVREIREQLRKRGVTYWFSEGDMKPGFDFARVVPSQIRECKVFLLILDEGATESLHVENELGLAFKRKREIMILPFRVGECALSDWMSYYLTHIQIMNNKLTPPLDKRVEELADYIAQFLGKGSRVEASALWTRETIAAGGYHTVGVRQDGTVVAVGDNVDGQCDVTEWRDIAAVSAGSWHTVGLRKDGAVVAVGDIVWGQCNVEGWRDIAALSAGLWHTVGLRKNGAVVAVGDNRYWQCDVTEWRDIVAVSAGGRHTVGLRKDGTVVAVGFNGSGQCNVSEWRDIAAVFAGYWHTVGLRKDGAVVAVGLNDKGQCNVTEWRNIALVSAARWNTVGLRKDGTVVAVGDNKHGQCNVSSWRDIVAVSAGGDYTVGLRNDGTVVATGWNVLGQCDVSNWRDIQLP